MSVKRRVNILAIDDQPLVLIGISTALSEVPRYRIGVAIDEPSKNIDLIKNALPDVLVIDHLASNGCALIRHVSQTMRSTKIVVFSRNCGIESALEAMDCGASGFVLKEGPTSELIRAIDTVLRDQLFVAAEYASRVIGEMKILGAQRETIGYFPKLNKRDLDILDRLVEGKTNEEIARDIGLGAQTVGNNMTSLMLKLRARNRVEAVIIAQKFKRHHEE